MRLGIFLAIAVILASACNGAPVRPTPPVPTPKAAPTATPTPPAGLTLELTSGAGTVGETITLELVLWNADSLAGYDVWVRVQNPEVARIATVPIRGLMRVLPDLPGPEVRIVYVDLFGILGHPRDVLTTVEVELLSRGTAQLVVQPLRLDDEDGIGLSASVIHSNVRVD